MNNNFLTKVKNISYQGLKIFLMLENNDKKIIL